VLVVGAEHSAIAPALRVRRRAWGIVAALGITETVSWGIVYYAFAAFLVPMERDLGYSRPSSPARSRWHC
jgi:hypothetical protein